MKSRKFKLSRVLMLRRRQEKQALLNLSVEINEQEQRQQAVEESKKMLEEMRISAGRELQTGVAASRWVLIVNYLDHQSRNFRLRYNRLLEMPERLSMAREALTIKVKDRKVIELLEENWNREKLLEEKRLEQASLDEIGLRNSFLETEDNSQVH
jgi:flagellar export protein FliJ